MSCRVALVGNYESNQQYSMLAFHECLRTGMPAYGFEIVSTRPVPRLGRRRGRFRKWRAYLDTYVLYPRELRRVAEEVDLVHVVDQGNAMYLEHAGGRPSLLTCHDVLPIMAALGEIDGWQVGRMGTQLQHWLLRSITRADRIACVSQYTRDNLVRILPMTGAKAEVILNGQYRPPFEFSQAELAALHRDAAIPAGTRYLFHVGGNSPYKNRVTLVDIFAQLASRPGMEGIQFVMAGHRPSDAVRERVQSQGIGERTIYRSGLSDRQIAALYAGAEALVFPSLLEGFGLPVIEAKLYGCPVFTSNRPPMTEIGGTACVYLDPTDPKAAADSIMSNWGRRAEMSEKGRLEVKTFETHHMLRSYAESYSGMLEGR